MQNIKEVEVDGDKVYLKGSKGKYKVVYPWKNNDGSINWKNLLTGGNLKELIPYLLFVVAFLMLILWTKNSVGKLLSCFDSLDKLEICKQIYGGENLKILPLP